MGEMSEFGMDFVSGDKPVITARQNGLKYKMIEEFSMETLKDFLTQLEAGNVEPWIKSEAVPDNSANNVKVAVAKNFDELVTKSEKDVLVEFYAPWCGHCKKLTPIYDELGEAMKDENVEIVKMDATANDVPPQFDVRGFPTLFGFRRTARIRHHTMGVARRTISLNTSQNTLQRNSRDSTGKERRRRQNCNQSIRN